MKKGEDNSFGVLSVCLGAVSLVLSLNNQLPALILAIVAIIISKKQERISKNSWAKWGKNLGIISIVVSIVILIIAIAVLASNPELLQQLSNLQGVPTA